MVVSSLRRLAGLLAAATLCLACGQPPPDAAAPGAMGPPPSRLPPGWEAVAQKRDGHLEAAHARVPPPQPLDRNCSAMLAPPAALAPAAAAGEAFFDRPIPRRIHQVWFGPEHAAWGPRMQRWRDWARHHGYDYKRWGAQDAEILAAMMTPRNRQILDFYGQARLYKAASNVVRLHALATFGGIYVDSDTQPPHDANGTFDLDAWLPLRNIGAMAEGGSRETDSSAIFWTNCLLMAAPGHPVIEQMVAGLAANHAAWQERFATMSEYTSGPFFLTRSWAGPMTMLRMDEAYAFHLLSQPTQRPDESDEEGARAMTAGIAARSGGPQGASEDAAAPPRAAGGDGSSAAPAAAIFPRLPAGFIDDEALARLAMAQEAPAEPAFAPQVLASWRSHTPPWTSLPDADRVDDPIVHAMRVTPAGGGPQRQKDAERAFNRPVPRTIHQIEVAAPSPACRARRAAWQRFAANFGYTYRLHARPAAGNPQELANLLMFSVLADEGGIVVGDRLAPPVHDGMPIDLATLVPLVGLVVVSQARSANLGTTSLWASGEIMMAAAGHPVVAQMEAQVRGNIVALAERGGADPSYGSGSMFISRALAGAVTVVPAPYLNRFGLGLGLAGALVEADEAD